MKTFMITISIITWVAFNCYSQDTSSKKEIKKPKAAYQIGYAKVTVWDNKTKDWNSSKVYQIEKLYKKDGIWYATNFFNESE